MKQESCFINGKSKNNQALNNYYLSVQKQQMLIELR